MNNVETKPYSYGGSKSIELLPCPFCGGKAKMRVFRTFNTKIAAIMPKYYVECDCGAEAPRSDFDMEKAAEYWNTRGGD